MSVRQLAEHIRLMRHLNGLTQSNLAELTGYSRSYVAKIETRARDLNWKTFERFAHAFEMTPSEFISATDTFSHPEFKVIDENGNVTHHLERTAELEASQREIIDNEKEVR